MQIGVTPKFDASGVKDPIVRGFVNSAVRFALQQKIPSKAVREFSKELGRTESSRFEEKYGVPSARLKHQFRAKKADIMIAETKRQLELLANEFSRTEEYWNRIFAYVTNKYFKKRRKEINAALKEARWYPYLTIKCLKEAHASQPERNKDCPHEHALLIYFIPTDKKQKERCKRLQELMRADHPYGWMFLRNVFCSIIEKNKRIDCLVTKNIQRVKITQDKLQRQFSDTPGKIMERIIEQAGSSDDPEYKRKIGDLAYEFNLRHAAFELVQANLMGLTEKKMKEVLNELDEIIKKFGKEGFESEYRELRKWRDSLPRITELKRRTKLHSPESFYPLDFLPAFLVNVYAMESMSAKEMKKTKGGIIDTSGARAGISRASLAGRKHIKELEEYIGLARVIGAEKKSDDTYLAKFG